MRVGRKKPVRSMWLLLSVVMPLIAAWFVTKLMNQGDFEPTCFLAALSGALLFPFFASILAWGIFDHSVSAGAFYDLQPRCAGAFVGYLVFDAVKTLRV